MSVSLENFDPHDAKRRTIDSPRSIEACQLQGVSNQDLLFKSKDAWRKELGNKTDTEVIQRRFEAFEQKRQKKLQIVITQRSKLIKGKIGNGSIGTRSEMQNSQGPTSAMLEREMHKLAKIERKNQGEIQQIIDYELKQQATRDKAEQNARKQKEKEERRQKELAEQNRKAEQKRLKEEARRLKKQQEDEAEAAARAKREYEKQIKLSKEAEKKRTQQAKETAEKAMEAQERQLELQAKTAAIMEQQQTRLHERRKELDRKDERRRTVMEEQQRAMKLKSEAISADKAVKLATAKENMDQIVQNQRKKYAKKQREEDKRQSALEEEKERMHAETKYRAQMKQQELQKVLENNQKKMMTKRKSIEKAHQQQAIRQQELATEKEAEREEQKRLNLEKDIERQAVVDRQVTQEQFRVKTLLKKQYEKEKKLTKAKQREEKLLEKRRLDNEINRQDKQDTVNRIQKMNEFKRQRLNEKIQSDAQRATQLQREKDKIIEKRKKLLGEVEANKAEILANFEKMKAKGTISQQSLQSMMMKRSIMQSTISVDKPQFSSPTSSTPSLVKKPRPLGKSQSQRRAPKLAQTQPIKVEKPRVSTAQLESNASQKIAKMRNRQNDELIVLLEKEQNAETNREKLLERALTEYERDQLEERFGKDRAKASHRIVALSEAHDRALRSLADKLGVDVDLEAQLI